MNIIYTLIETISIILFINCTVLVFFNQEFTKKSFIAVNFTFYKDYFDFI